MHFENYCHKKRDFQNCHLKKYIFKIASPKKYFQDYFLMKYVFKKHFCKTAPQSPLPPPKKKKKKNISKNALLKKTFSNIPSQKKYIFKIHYFQNFSLKIAPSKNTFLKLLS